MDGDAADKDLFAFVDSLDVKEKKVDTSQVLDAKVCNKDEKESDVWSDIAVALNRWSQRILDAETRYIKIASFREDIEASLQRQWFSQLSRYR